MDRQNQLVIVSIVLAFALLTSAIVFANSWINSEIDSSTQVKRLPTFIEQQRVIAQKKLKEPAKKRLAVEFDLTPAMNPVERKKETLEKAVYSKPKKDKIIYEIPLDDLILVQ